LEIEDDEGNHEIRGLCLYKLRRLDEAIESYQALEFYPYGIWEWYAMGLCLYNLGRYNETIECNNVCLKTDLSDYDAALSFNSIGAAYYKEGKYEHEEL
jgi:tetratricopeptide (TPR) repeat protein